VVEGGNPVFRAGVESREEQLALLVQSVTDYAIFLLDIEGNVVTWNSGAERIKGYAAEEIIGRHFSAFYTPEDLARGHPNHELEIAEEVGRFEEEGWRVRSDGTRFWANVVITAIRDGQGRLTGFGKVTRDLTARRRAEEVLRTAQAELINSNEELSRFAGVAAHDLNDPLHTLAGLAQMLADRHGPGLSPEALELTEHIRSSAARMQQLVGDLLTYARSGTAARPAERVQVATAVTRVLADLDAAVQARGAKVTVAVPVEAEVWSDVYDVDLVVQNLVSNALKFGAAERPVVEVSAERNAGFWRTAVRDNGPGVEPTHQTLIFEAFHRTHPQDGIPGSGLGLSISKRLVERHGGRIGVEPAPGGGSCFWFTLPVGTA
jgi:PAS domain S-box-containing protein